MQKKVMALCLRVQFFLANPVYVTKNASYHFLVHSSAKDSLRSAINEVSFLSYILEDRPIGRTIAPPPPWLRCCHRLYFDRLVGRWTQLPNSILFQALLTHTEP